MAIPRGSRRRGYALLVVLWVLVSAGALTSLVATMGRESFHASRNRIVRERALWRAEDCLARGREKIDELLLAASTSPVLGASLWRVLDTAVINALPPRSGCEIALRAAGSRVDINGDEVPLQRALSALQGPTRAPGLLDALVDWRDPDSLPRLFGAEADWYALQGRVLPRNDSMADVRELVRVRGFEQMQGLDQLFWAEPGRISIANASGPILAAIPGFNAETVSLILAWRSRGLQLTDVMALAGSLTQASADTLRAHYSEIARLTVLEPDAWVLTSIGVSGSPPESVTVEVRVVRNERRAVVVRRRAWL